ncbi:hypothetical protein So717_01850 [Roseobacter cerasinus]|uniref:Uncharacterized protein n=1 Tax=Roseobacter cerasinus TaxID=2602289 RepID=A0A640VL53_9RHOB|nr:hypothetical protein [Roseobacter cerasinus]GFE48432.1 hypothetical protein So717_01850 [Roseobacter cerasinus]
MRAHALQMVPKRLPYRLVFWPATSRSVLPCWLALPEHPVPGQPPLVAVHGIRRGAEQQAALFAERAAAQGRVVIAPIFDKASWLGYQQAVLCGRADLALLDLLLSLRVAGVVTTERFDLFGFSGGAQFAHRFAMLHPDRLRRLSVASPGWYTFPDTACYPYGLWPRPDHTDGWGHRLAANLHRFLTLPITVSVGACDSRRDRNTRSGPQIDAQQGPHRLARARSWAQALRRAACELRIQPDIALHVLPGCGHHFETCMRLGGLDRIVLPKAGSGQSRVPTPHTRGARA